MIVYDKDGANGPNVALGRARVTKYAIFVGITESISANSVVYDDKDAMVTVLGITAQEQIHDATRNEISTECAPHALNKSTHLTVIITAHVRETRKD